MWTRLVYGAMLSISIVALAANGLSTTGDRDGRKLFGGYRITPKFCRASKTLPRSDPRSHGPTICMFNHECTQRQGEVVGACMDGFLFGACCQLQGSVDSALIVEQELYQQSAAAQSYESYGNQQQHHNHGAAQTNQVTASQNSVEEQTHYADRPALQSHNRPSTNNFGGFLEVPTHQNNNNNYGSVSVEDEISNSVDGSLSSSNEVYPSPPRVEVNNDSVSVSSPSPDYASSSSQTTTASYNTASNTESYSSPTGSVNSYSPTQQGELPTRIPTGPYESTAADSVIGSGPEGYAEFADQIMHIQSGDFTHSGITHPGVDAVIVDEGTTGYGNPSIPSSADRINLPSTQSTIAEPSQSSSSTTTERTFKITHGKPLFRPKPTKVVTTTTTTAQDSDQYVLIQTINHDVPIQTETHSPKPQGAMSVNDIESIESIILMLNDTKTGPQYNSDTSSTESTGAGSTLYYDNVQQDNDNTATIYGIQGTTSQKRPSTTGLHYITEKTPSSTPRPPSTSYVYSPHPTKRPIQVQSTISSSYGAVHQDINPEHLEIPSSSESYYHTSQVVPVTKRPVLITSSSFATRLPTTGYIYSTQSTARPTIYEDEIVTTVGTKKPTHTTKVSTKRPTQPTLSPASSRPKVPSPTTIQSLSTNFVYASTAPPKRITKPTNKVNPNRKNVTETPLVSRPIFNTNIPSTPSPIVYEEIIQSKPLNQYPTTERPSPTVHITPKPTSNQVTSSIWSSPPSINHYTTTQIKNPYVFVSTERPISDYSTPGYTSGYVYSSTPSYQSTPSHQFDDPGYYGSTSLVGRPVIHHQGSSVSPPQPGFYGPTPPFGDEVQQFVEFSTIRDEVYTSQNDQNNFPPVRNPNLNTTSNAALHPSVNEYEISTPSFVEDEVLDEKMGVLVSKIVQSLQGNFEQLADVVYDDVVQQDPLPLTVRPLPNTKRPSGATTQAPAKRPASSKPTARPAVTTKKPNVIRVTTTVATKKPAGSTTTVKRPTKKPTTATTKKPVVTKVPVTRKPTTKPTKKVVPTTTVQQDEVIDEEEESEEGEEEEEETNEENAEQTTAFEEGRLQCGVRPQLKTGRIVGGKAAAFGEFPWQVLVRESTWLGLFTKNKCGGVLISKMYVMTAAHCQPGFLASLVTVFGEFDISGELEAKRSVTKNVRRVVVHRDYDASTFENDLALLELESAIHYDTHIVPICMPTDAADFTGRVATVTGWGRLKYGGGVPTVMQEVQVPVIENSVCQEMFHTAGHNKKILSSFLCAGYANGQKDSCEGDSGGPLVIQRPDGRWELAGTVSHGIKCAAPYLPGVYMRTTYYKPWLKSITGVH